MTKKEIEILLEKFYYAGRVDYSLDEEEVSTIRKALNYYKERKDWNK